MRFNPRLALGLGVQVLIATILFSAHPGAAESSLPREFGGASPLQWSVRLADSEIGRRGNGLFWKEGGSAKWDYSAGLFALSLLKLNEHVSDARYLGFASNTIASFISQDGQIRGYKAEDYNLDNLNAGRTALALYRVTKDERFKKAVALLRTQLDHQPRTRDGGFWHKQRYPNQMWLDGLYMAQPFYGQSAILFQEPAASFDDIAKQFRLAGSHTYEQTSGLFYHGWDESKQQDWANKSSGASSNFWGRAMGWYGMGLVDVLDLFPTNHPARNELLALLQKLCAGVAKHQDRTSGLWYQVLDQPGRQGNYLEASASSMFVYTLAKGVNQGYLNHDYVPILVKGYQGLIDKLIKSDSQGHVSISQCCSVAGLGYGRDGSFDYYVKEPIVENDLKAVGPFILAGIELQQLLGLPRTILPTRDRVEPASAKAATRSAAAEWSRVPEILARIKPPVFPAHDFPITDYGALAGGKADCTEAIRKAIQACAQAGGGRVIVPAGVFVTGPIHLRSNVELHLEGGATLKFLTDPDAYLPVVFTRYEGMECYNYSPLIYAFEQENIAVTGEGVLDGQADEQNWWAWKGRKAVGPQDNAPNQKPARDRLVKMVEQQTPVTERRFGLGSYLRPNFIQPFRCKNVLISGVRIRRSPMWEIHPVLCQNVTVHGVDILSHGPNNDGCDPECCQDVLIEDCSFDTGDDCIAIKSGRNEDGRRIGVASENLVIRNCTMKDGHGGVVVGSEISGGCRNVFAEDCHMDSPHLERVLRLKSNAVRGGIIENIFVRNINVGQVSDSVLTIDFLYEEGAKGAYKPVARNIVMERISVNHTPRVLNIAGFPGAEIQKVRICDSTFRQVRGPDVVKDAQDIKVENCTIERQN